MPPVRSSSLTGCHPRAPWILLFPSGESPSLVTSKYAENSKGASVRLFLWAQREWEPTADAVSHVITVRHWCFDLGNDYFNVNNTYFTSGSVRRQFCSIILHKWKRQKYVLLRCILYVISSCILKLYLQGFHVYWKLQHVSFSTTAAKLQSNCVQYIKLSDWILVSPSFKHQIKEHLWKECCWSLQRGLQTVGKPNPAHWFSFICDYL